MKRLAAQLSATVLAALFSLLTLATVSTDGDGEQALTEPATPGTAFRFLSFAVRFVVARLFWGS